MKRIMRCIALMVFCLMLGGVASEKSKCDTVEQEPVAEQEVEVQKVEVPTVMLESEEEVIEAKKEEIKEPIPEIKHEEVEEEVEQKSVMISIGKFRVTAYCSCRRCCSVWADMRPLDENGNQIVYGSSGEVLTPEYSIAVDKEVIPYGTKVYINGKEYIAQDTGVRGNAIDLYMESHEKAKQWGVKELEVFIIENKN